MTKDEWHLLGYGLLTAGLMGLVLVPILIRWPNFPRIFAEAILGGIALAVFSLYRFRDRRKTRT